MNIRLLIAFLSGIVLLFQNNVSGQSFCGNTGAFSITPSEGCAPLKVNVKNLLPKSENVSYAFNFNRSATTVPGPGEFTQDSSFTYTLPGTYTILQFGSANGTGFSQCQDVVVRETRAPNAELMVCQNGRARLTLISDSISNSYDGIDIDWGDGSRQSVNTKNGNILYLDHFYAAGASSTVKIQGRYSNAACQQSLQVTTLTGTSTSQLLKGIRIRSVEMLASGEAKVLYEGMENVPTEVLIDKGDGQFVSTGKSGQSGGTQAVTIGGLNPQQIYRFMLASKDFCDKIIESAVVSSMTIKEGTFALDEIISVSWEHYPNTESIMEYQLKRDGAVIFTSVDQLSYLDTDVKCGVTYKYEIVAIIENDVRSYSTSYSTEPKSSSPGRIERASVTVKDNSAISTQVELSGEGLTSSFDLIVERALLGSTNFQKVSATDNQSLQFEDTGVNTSENAYCYRFTYENACNMKSPLFDPPICSILLKTQTPDIAWTGQSSFTDAVDSYDLQRMDLQGNIIDVIPKQLGTTHTLDLASQSDFSFRIEAKSQDGSFSSYSNILNFKSKPILLVPDAFTPNGDAYNERFEVKAYFISDFKMSVFDRWGEVVFHSNDVTEGWDGKIENEKAAGGYYFYKIEATNVEGDIISKNGSFLLIR
ncbi:gliding motility-associated C-terminal domain-containing protein [Dyadobacter sp. CY323]|uniref:T9SS type B sorting domain-containing protein n=1 Tax=Dyadobacter sp. CY323 TaxID=2907302 RepID=UPI001F2AC075|nr:gliding motility-associated C-terminal domain-containing protein [Dyadobacter sp. CY323]MCE6989038.1 gliding motility-associated C-terminal domain-containing protein [Dyadobacter sp. CY323]